MSDTVQNPGAAPAVGGAEESQMVNVDYQAAQHAQKIIARVGAGNGEPKNLDNVVTKALGVLQENGVYAFFLFLHSRSTQEERKNALVVSATSLHLLQALHSGWALSDDLKVDEPPAAKVLKHITDEVTKDSDITALHRLLLAKETLERMLTYTRYAAKAWAQEQKAKKPREDGEKEQQGENGSATPGEAGQPDAPPAAGG